MMYRHYLRSPSLVLLPPKDPSSKTDSSPPMTLHVLPTPGHSLKSRLTSPARSIDYPLWSRASVHSDWANSLIRALLPSSIAGSNPRPRCVGPCFSISFPHAPGRAPSHYPWRVVPCPRCVPKCCLLCSTRARVLCPQ